MKVRLNKFLSQSGVSSRREADKMIENGRIKINGRVVNTLGIKIDDDKDTIEVNGKEVKKDRNLIYLLLNKPSGYLVTLKDPFKRPTIMNFLSHLEKRVFPVGRLDYDTEGLLLLTNDGELAYRLMHPRYKIKKVYLAKVNGNPRDSELSTLEKGVYLDNGKTAPTKISRIYSGSKESCFRIEIYEGRKREIKRLFEYIGHRVLKLKRVKFAGLDQGKLKKGQWRHLTKKELLMLKKQVGLN